ncbi:hypothetical protein [Rhabdochlamydiaceae symbiont of Dictyostelium giganteum]|uniref:hypothetical protein n=1 Tax=Rhabdochlamydiaceae symbiont of Dictyostelium giganteum TaxID=3342349 RepID=UPI00384DC586
MTSIPPRPHIISQLDYLTDFKQFTHSYTQAEKWYQTLKPLHAYQFKITITSLFLGAIAVLIALKKNPRVIPHLIISTTSLVLASPIIELCSLWKKVHEECKLHNLLKDLQLELRYAWQAKSDAICELTSSDKKLPTQYRGSRDDILTYMDIAISSYHQVSTPYSPTGFFSYLSPNEHLWRELCTKKMMKPAHIIADMDLITLSHDYNQIPHFSKGVEAIQQEAQALFQKPPSTIDPDTTASFVKLNYNVETVPPRAQTQPWERSRIIETYLKSSLKAMILHSFFQIETPFYYTQDF